MFKGRLFQIFAAAAGKLLSPALFRRVEGTKRRAEDADLRFPLD